jgi:hypothetical protein
MSQDDDDDGGDDAKLRSLRAVWLAMPDEDPPERGLDALMAAARTKAAEMAEGSSEAVPKQVEHTPSWWERFVAGFRRPAVLAMATVVVLVAGAVLVGNRGMKASAPPTNNAAPSKEDVPTERREHETLKDNAPPPEAIGAPGGHDDKSAVTTNGPQHLGGAPHQAAQEGAVKESTKTGEAITNDRWEAVPMDPTAEEVAKTKLLDDAKTAAVRGDCSSARTVARQLEKQDLGFYRSRVVPDRDIAGCLEGRAGQAGATTIDSTTATKPAD